VAKGLEQIRQLLLEHTKSSTEQSRLVNEQIESLITASQKMGRKDWFNLAVGALINLALVIALPPEVTHKVFEVLKASLTGIIHLLPPVLATAQQLT